MGPYYEYLCKEYSWAQDDALVAKMKATNDAEIAKLEAVIKGPLVRIVAIAGRKSRSGRNNCLCVWCVGGPRGGSDSAGMFLCKGGKQLPPRNPGTGWSVMYGNATPIAVAAHARRC